MKVTVNYRCDRCDTTFPAHCGVPDSVDNVAVGHGCPGVSAFSGTSGTSVSYMCEKCGHVTRTDITRMIPAMRGRRHGCGEVCGPT